MTTPRSNVMLELLGIDRNVPIMQGVTTVASALEIAFVGVLLIVMVPEPEFTAVIKADTLPGTVTTCPTARLVNEAGVSVEVEPVIDTV